MLKIFYGRDYDEYNGMKVIHLTSKYFNHVYKRVWLDNDLVKEMILDVDKSKVIGNGIIDSPFLGLIPPEKLSGGIKNLIMMLFLDNIVFNGSSCGDNCLPWMLKIAENKDVYVNFKHYILLEEPFEVEILDTGIIAHSNKELTEGLMISDEKWVELNEKLYGKWE